MTKDEFIDAYMARSDLPASARTPDGFIQGRRQRIALPCACGDDSCEGWAMIHTDLMSLKDHITLYAPDPEDLPISEIR